MLFTFCDLRNLCQLLGSKVMLKILQAKLQQYMNCELPDVQAGFRKGRGTRDQIANIRWIMEKEREFHPELALTHVHRVDNAIQPFCPLSFPSPPAFILSQHQGLF